MTTAYEILASLRSLGIDIDALAGFLAEKIGTSAYERLVGAGKATVSHFIKRFRSWRADDLLLEVWTAALIRQNESGLFANTLRPGLKNVHLMPKRLGINYTVSFI